jgi:uncharacterized protein (TIGR00661 family)
LINGNKINKNSETPKILIAPLDWGLGHATRCIPIINELISQNCEVIIAAGGSSFSLLKKEFPALVFVRIKGYNIKYSRNKRWMPLKLLFQSPKIIFLILKENRQLKKIRRDYKIDAVVSDNRFGMYHKSLPSIYITHQLLIKTGNSFTEKVLLKLHYYFIKKYSNCWVPDSKEKGLAGNLSHPINLPANTIYIGPLSRFKKKDNISIVYDILISISGPEPQRSVFEKIMLEQIKKTSKKILFVRGLPDENKGLINPSKNIKIANHFTAEELNMAFQQSEIVICRSGYTTIMDLIKINKRAVLIPTLGQTEQEYLANYLKEKKYFYSVDQNNFSFDKDINSAIYFSPPNEKIYMDEYKKVITEFVQSLKSVNFAPQ